MGRCCLFVCLFLLLVHYQRVHKCFRQLSRGEVGFFCLTTPSEMWEYASKLNAICLSFHVWLTEQNRSRALLTHNPEVSCTPASATFQCWHTAHMENFTPNLVWWVVDESETHRTFCLKLFSGILMSYSKHNWVSYL